MRKILFRGYHGISEGWVEGNLIGRDVIIPKKQLFHVAFNELLPTKDGLAAHIVFPETVGQYTGRKDKNGVKVFEGDIIKCRDILTNRTFTGVVSYGSCSFAIYDGSCSHYRWMDYDVEVIGNAHDNPELLEDV